MSQHCLSQLRQVVHGPFQRTFSGWRVVLRPFTATAANRHQHWTADAACACGVPHLQPPTAVSVLHTGPRDAVGQCCGLCKWLLLFLLCFTFFQLVVINEVRSSIMCGLRRVDAELAWKCAKCFKSDWRHSSSFLFFVFLFHFCYIINLIDCDVHRRSVGPFFSPYVSWNVFSFWINCLCAALHTTKGVPGNPPTHRHRVGSR